jgi:uncharacterized protein (TIGR02679 family)
VSRPRADPALQRALLAARDKREERGATGDGTVLMPALEPEEALALDGLLSPRKPVLPGQRRRIALSRFEAALRENDIDPASAYEAAGGRPLRDRPAERATARQTRIGLRSWLAAHDAARAHPSLAAWLDEAALQGRIRTDTRPLVEQALRVVGALPAREPVQRTVLAAALLDGDPHGLDAETPLHRLTVQLLAAAAGLDDEVSPREVWATSNVLVDPISSSVAVLNLPAPADGRLTQLLALMRGSHVVLTHGQLDGADLRWPAGLQCFTCENPSVLVAAERVLGPRSAPLICTGGRPSDAVRMLLGSMSSSGARIGHHGDFDLAGVQILRDLQTRYDAVSWRFDVASLRAALGRLGRRAPDFVGATLEDAVGALEAGVAEELLIDDLLADLGSSRGRHVGIRGRPRPDCVGRADAPS